MLNNLKIGSKITVLKPNSLIPENVYGTLEGFFINRYAQYENALYLFIKPFRCRKITRMVITEGETVYILKGQLKDSWRRENISKTEQVTVAQLHRLTENDIKDQLIYKHDFRTPFKGIENNYERFADMTADYMINNNIKAAEAEENDNYINYIKSIIGNYNVLNLKQYFINEDYDILVKCIDKAINYDWQ